MAKTIDPIYKQYCSKVIKSIASTEFYDFFMASLAQGKNIYQFSNRRIEKSVDERWVVAIENVIKPMQEIINNPRNFIVQEEVIVNVALAKRVTPDTVRHLAQHGNMIDDVTEDSVRPNKLMEKFKEDSWNTYENRFVYTLLEMTWEFVDKRYEAIFSAMGEEQGAYLKMSNESTTYAEKWTVNMDIRINQQEDLLSADEKNESIFARIARLHRILNTYRGSTFAKELAKYGKIRPPLVRTNAIAKNPNFKACHKLWDFILAYTDVGYKIEILEQSPEIDDVFRQDINNSILFNYIILKNYMTLNGDKVIDMTNKYKKRALKPKYIKEIVEEITKNYDLPDVEIRKVLIEELTKAQLMQEEENERLRLVEAKEKEMEEQRKKEEKERREREKAELKERIRQQREAEREQARLEKERREAEEKERREKERVAAEEARMLALFRQELDRAFERRDALIAEKAAEAEARAAAEAEAEARRRQQEAEEKQKEKERAKAAAEKEKERARAAAEKEKERAKAAAEKEKERAKAAAEKEKERAKAAAEKEKAREKERLAKEKEKERAKALAEKEKAKEKERLTKEKEKERAKALAEKEKAKEKERLAKEKERAKALAEKEKAREKKAGAKAKPAVKPKEEKPAEAVPETAEELLKLPEAEPVIEPAADTVLDSILQDDTIISEAEDEIRKPDGKSIPAAEENPEPVEDAPEEALELTEDVPEEIPEPAEEIAVIPEDVPEENPEPVGNIEDIPEENPDEPLNQERKGIRRLLDGLFNGAK